MQKNGFTLIEVIFVVLIIGIISSILIPNYSKIEVKTKEVSLKAMGSQIRVALESYRLGEGAYPTSTTISDLSTALESSGDMKSLLKNPFTNKIFDETDPSGRIEYIHHSDNDSYELKVYGYENKDLLLYLK